MLLKFGTLLFSFVHLESWMLVYFNYFYLWPVQVFVAQFIHGRMSRLWELTALLSLSTNVVLASFILYKLWIISTKSEEEIEKPEARVLMFPDGGYQCNYWTAGDCTYQCCTLLHHKTNKTRLKELLEHAEKSIDVCMFVLSCAVLLDALIEAHRKGVTVRIVCDNMKISGSAYKITEAGLDVRADNSSSMMHHKFIIIDKEMLLTGSYNWTASGAAYNRENVFITDEKYVVDRFIGEFEKLWVKFEGSSEIRYEPITSCEVIRNRFVHRSNTKS